MVTVFTCPRCKAKSFHPEDFKHGYCAHCQAYTASVSSSEWTGAEWERVTREFPDHLANARTADPVFMLTAVAHAEAAVFRWRHGVEVVLVEDGSVPPPQWTDAEWLRVMAEFPPDISLAHVTATVFQWRRTPSTPDSPPSTPDGGQ